MQKGVFGLSCLFVLRQNKLNVTGYGRVTFLFCVWLRLPATNRYTKTNRHTTGHVTGLTGSLLGLVEDRLVPLNGDMSMECAVRAIQPGMGAPLP